jgi:insertion element IS1 protein InsB
MVLRDGWPRCQSPKHQENGHSHNGQQNPQGHDCGRQVVDGFDQDRVSADIRALSAHLLVERMSWRGSCRAVGVKLKWRLSVLVQSFEALPDHLHVQPVASNGEVMRQRLAVEADELSSFVHKKAHQPWIWIAMDAKTRQVMALHVGDRSRKRAQRLGAKMPQAYRQHATFSPDQYVVYAGVIPAAQQRAISKVARQTHPLERCNNTRRQRGSRLVRDAWSLSNKLAHHIGAITLFICHSTLTRAAA